MTPWLIIGGLLYLALVSFAWCALIVAGRADARAERPRLRVIQGGKT